MPDMRTRPAKRLVNGTDVMGQQAQNDGDQIEVAGVNVIFYLLSETTSASD